ncbi:MAG: RNA polymerase sigma factor [Deltaproteobacteria bacterium]|nr:RNA polymerase sigma factor [Deltaproteobacteria bacterium]
MDLDVFLPAILSGDTHAFGRWMAAAEGTIRDSLRSFVTVVDVEAVLQEAMLRVWQVRGRFERDGRPNGLLRLGLRIARNLAVSEVRRLKSRPVPEEDLEQALTLAEGARLDALEPDPMLRAVLASCHERLPEKPRQALDARLAGEGARPDDELAEALGMRLNTFLQNFGRARKLLADCLKKNGISIEEGLGA